MKKKEAEKFSPGLEAFLDYLQYASGQYNIALTSCSEAEAATQDLLHSLELEDHDRTYMERLTRRMKKIRRERRLAKDTVLRSGPIVDWVEKNAAVIKSLERLLGEIRKAEAKQRTASTYLAPKFWRKLDREQEGRKTLKGGERHDRRDNHSER